MPRGDKSAYTDKQKRQARHIEESYEERGVDPDKAAEIAWATVNKETGGGKLSGSGRGHPVDRVSARKGGRIGAHALRAVGVGPVGGGDAQAQCRGQTGCFGEVA